MRAKFQKNVTVFFNFFVLGRRGQQQDDEFVRRGVQVAAGGNGERRGTSVLRVRPWLGFVESGQDAGQIRVDVPTVTSRRRVRVVDETHYSDNDCCRRRRRCNGRRRFLYDGSGGDYDARKATTPAATSPPPPQSSTTAPQQ